MSGHEDADDARRRYKAPYTAKHPIPTIAKYREEKEARKAEAVSEGPDDGADLEPEQTRRERAKEGWRSYWYGESNGEEGGDQKQQDEGAKADGVDVDGDGDIDKEDEEQMRIAQDTSEATPIADPKKRRKGKNKEERAEREVTDPITHLPVKIYDFTTESLKQVEENPPPFGSTVETATGPSNKNKSGRDLHNESEDMKDAQDSMIAQFPPPNFDVIRRDLISINKIGISVGLAGSVFILIVAVGVERVLNPEMLAHYTGIKKQWVFRLGTWPLVALASLAGISYLIAGIRAWMANRIDDTWEDQVWEANLQAKKQQAKAHETESVSWLNSLLSSVWPLVNPDLFTSLADTLEDVMQASLPSLVQMVSVEDIGQGSESLRILGIRWLPTGAAARSVGSDGSLESVKDSKESKNDRKVSGEGEVDHGAGEDQDQNDENGKSEDNKNEDGTEKAAVAEGMEAEEGDFINMEVAFAYRARKSQSFKERTKDLHMYLAFWLPGKLKIPVWVDVKGIVGIVRLRLQLAPDPPFFQLMTMTFLGQPKVDIKCIPIVKHGLNIMDLPIISNFVQGSVDAAMAEYVAPKSLTLDLKDMLAGDDFKKDTAARGVIVVDIKRGYDFKMGDASIPILSEGGSDPYVSVGWAKFGKPMFSTRVLIKEMEPYWHERAVLLVTPEELNVDERLRIQLWDSDRFTADDDLGRIEVDLKQIMRGEDTNGKMHDRTDGFRALKAGESMPGKLEWSVGYFSKARLQACQFEKQTFDKDIRSREDLENKVEQTCQRKLREAMIKKGRHSKDADELEQQKEQERKSLEDALIISAPPPDGYPSGVFSIQVHQITGLELEKQSKAQVEKYENHESEAEDDDDLPSAYCTVIINHKKVFKTRTKPKNSKPFYNAGTEKFVKDWRNTEVYVSVRDARVDEEDALLGIVHLPLGEIFQERAQINGFYPLMGGVGHGRVRISMVWRSVQLQAPPEALGWDYGTVEVKPSITSSDLPSDLQNIKLKFHTNLSSGKMYPHNQEWKPRKNRSLFLPVHRRYASNLAIRFKHHGMFKDKTAAFSIFWLKDIPDEEEREITLPVWKGDYERARASCLDRCGEKVGSITLKLTFWSGLGNAHQKWANKDPDMANVMEVLDVARDNYESMKREAEVGIVEEDGDDSGSESDEGDSSDEEDDGGADKKDGDGDHKKAGKTDIVDKALDYRKDAKQKHRRQRGVMQYKLPRNLQWAFNRAGRVEDKFTGIFRRHTREPGIETEV